MPRKKKTPKAESKPELLSPELLGALSEKGQEAASALTIYGTNPTELSLPATMAEADYLAYGVNIGRAMEFAAWRTGDWVNYGLLTFGYKDYTKMSGVTGLDEQYLRSCSSVAARVVPALRSKVSLERARLMLARLGKGESVDHCFKRLEAKTTKQIKDMAGSGSSSSKKKKHRAWNELSMEEVYSMARDLLLAVEAIEPNKWAVLAQLETAEKSGRVIEGLLGQLKALFDAVKEEFTKN